mgnify:CR=1 FL=1
MSKAVIAVRTILFYAAVVAALVLFVPAMSLLFLRDRAPALRFYRLYLRILRLLLRWIVGIEDRVEGLENLPPAPYLLASRHESAWEVMFYPLFFDDPAAFAKQEIFDYPLGGRIARVAGHIAIDRTGDLAALKAAFEGARQTVAAGRSVLIFPSGTRYPEGRDRIQRGVVALYELLNVPCVPVVLDSGRCWPPNDWLKYPGRIRVRVGAAIPPGLEREAFLAALRGGLGLPSPSDVPTADRRRAPEPAAP